MIPEEVLIVNDGSLLFKMMGGLLEHKGYHLSLTDSPEDALELLSSRNIMLVVMKHNATEAEIGAVVETIEKMGYGASPIPGAQRTAVGLIGNDGRVDTARLMGLGGVLECIPVTQPYKAIGKFAAALDVFQDLTKVSSGSRRELAAKTFVRIGNRLIKLHEKQGNAQAGEAVKERLDAVERDMAAAQ